MKTKIISFIFLMVFVVTAVNCGADAKDPITSGGSNTFTSYQELAGNYRSTDAQETLSLNTNQTFTLIRRTTNSQTTATGSYQINNLGGYLELSLLNGNLNFEIQRNARGEIVTLVEVLTRNLIFNRITEQEENQIQGPPTNSSDSESTVSSEEDVTPPAPLNLVQRELIHQGLIGRYRGPFDNQQALLDIRYPNTLYLTRNGVERSYPYTISWENNINNHPLLIFNIEGVARQVYYLSIPRREEIEMLPNFRILRFFRLPNSFRETFERINDQDNEIHQHDEH